MEVYCTRPSCTKPENTIPDECLTARAATEICCANCKMPLILQARFVAIDLLGSGGFGRTFKAKDILRANDQIFSRNIRVIKQLHPINHPGQILTPSTLNYIEEKFGEEASTLEELRHQQIPRFWDYFHEEVNEETGRVQKFFYLVQDYIAGHNLDQELQQKGKFAEDEVINILKEILNILKYIHNYDGTHGVIHRDIKPANIMHCSYDGRLYLIDFGAVRQIVQGLPVDTTSIVLDARFAPPEQSRGEKLSSASDLYALATTCLSLLTGNKNPNRLLFKSKLKENLQIKDQHFAEALDKMLQYEPEDRPQSAQEVLDILSAELKPDLLATQAPAPNSLSTQTSNPDPHPQVSWFKRFSNGVERLPQRWRSIIGFSWPFFLGIAIAVAVHPKPPEKPPVKPPLPNSQYFSRGEEALIPPNPKVIPSPSQCSTAYDYKRQGMEAFANKDFTQAENHFNRAKQQFKQAAQTTTCEVDPETVIYAYNATVAQTPSNLSLPTIAVVIPGYSDHREIALEILRGVAQSLNADQPLFQILIAKENIDGDQITPEKVATYISQKNIPEDSDFVKSEILGVIGHYTSINTWKAGKIYGAAQLSETEKLVLISPTSTAIRKPNILDPSKDLNRYVFRTASNDALAASDLAKYMWDTLRVRKATIVYDPSDGYSDSLRREFNEYLIRNGINHNNHIQYCSLITYTPMLCIQQAKIPPAAEALLLFASRDALDIEIDIINLGNQQFKMLAGDVLYSQKILDLKEAASGMIIAVFSHKDIATPQFRQKAEDIGWIKDITWRSMSSYDAAQVFVKALTDLNGKSNKTRQDIYSKLNEPNFSTLGSTTEVKFYDDKDKKHEHDRKLVKGVGVLVKVKEITPDKYGFELEQTPERNNP
ncbi:bifunctional serine/threonine-protein kinase/ABC transporter substrate-binding protein [Anabaena sp. UHCC 0399]|uniref:bifunctional serine/threonine-protein kinase/ABC transporter substrate-binding protein n=1 Tax=Anabaena sp. UHCC 0399 TaxID=3110238 RepID=UPI002B20ED5E|nr:bifunctional serine/threonine-protein kinase/ABC transporter substrate-binding protein [Anabaena sp. UHCC 0399]MEA5568561.1 bifunctional serine/threonine-protein kinase/ABC transporter substrate-binding protein [Anabaena sp. UHCC 0399]